MHKPGKYDHSDWRFITDNIENEKIVKALVGEDVLLKHLNSDISIMVDAKDLQGLYRGSRTYINAVANLVSDPKGFNGQVEVKCLVACGFLYKLKNIITGVKVNILDHLDLLLPKYQDCVGLFTFQNGIQNKFDHFKNMADKILEKLPETPLCIGFYNQTNGAPLYGILGDIERFSNEWHLNACSVLATRQMLATLARRLASYHANKYSSFDSKAISSFSLDSKPFSAFDSTRLFSVNSNVLWAHIAHSEAGLIAHEILTTKKYSIFEQHYALDCFLKNHLITLTYGPVAPVPDIVRLAINTYSKDDAAVVPRYSQHYTNKPNYTLTFVQSEVPKKEQCPAGGDHAFDKATYQEALKKNLDILREKFGIYDCR